MKFKYDNSADVLYVTLEDRAPNECRFVENDSGDILKIDRMTDEPVGVTIVSFLLRTKKGLDVRVPEIEIDAASFKKQAKRIMRAQKRA